MTGHQGSIDKDQFETALDSLLVKSVAIEMYDRARAREQCLSMVDWEDMDEDERNIREHFVEECMAVMTSQFEGSD